MERVEGEERKGMGIGVCREEGRGEGGAGWLKLWGWGSGNHKLPLT